MWVRKNTLSASLVLALTLTLTLTLSFIPSGKSEEIPQNYTVECIDDLEDFTNSAWYTPHAPFNYFESTGAADFPSELQKLENAHGIFHFGTKYFNMALKKDGKDISSLRPAILYIRWTTYAKDGYTLQPYLVPSSNYDLNYFEKKLDETGLSWKEQLFNLRGKVMFDEEDALDWNGIDLGVHFYKSGGHFLIDKIILVQGVDFSLYYDTEKVSALCPPKENVPTTTTAETSPPATGFTCPAAGYFGDAENCSIFHLCREDEIGELIDAVFSCPPETQWCQQLETCERVAAQCPCTQ